MSNVCMIGKPQSVLFTSNIFQSCIWKTESPFIQQLYCYNIIATTVKNGQLKMLPQQRIMLPQHNSFNCVQLHSYVYSLPGSKISMGETFSVKDYQVASYIAILKVYSILYTQHLCNVIHTQVVILYCGNIYG